MDGEQTKYLCIREVLPISGVAEVCIGSRVVFLCKGVVCTPKCGQTQNKYHGCTSQHYGAGHQGYSWGIRGSDTQLWRQGGFFWVQNYTKKKRALIKNKTGKQTNPANTQEKKFCTHFTGQTYLATPKTETVRRYLYFNTILTRLLSITWLPHFHLWPLDTSAVCCEPSARGLLSCASSGQEERLRKQVRKASVWPRGSDPLHKALLFHVRDYVTNIDVAPRKHSAWSCANSLSGESQGINASWLSTM